MKGPLATLRRQAGAAANLDEVATSVFGLHHGTRLSGSDTTFQTRYVLIRSGVGFGACAVEDLPLDEHRRADLCGLPIGDLINHSHPAIATAALDAWLAHRRPWGIRDGPTTVDGGPPEKKAAARDALIARLLGETPGRKIALIGVVNPLIAAIREIGCQPLPCDLWLRQTAWGDAVSDSAAEVIARADAVVATGMTLGNGTFEPIAMACHERGIPLALYAQTGAAIARELVGRWVTAACCEPFPFSQCSSGPTTVYLPSGELSGLGGEACAATAT